MHKLITLTVASLLMAGSAVWAGSNNNELFAKAKADNPTRVEALFSFVDDGQTLTVNGRARGMTPGELYISLVYDIGAVGNGPDACAPTIFNPQDPNHLLNTMFLGFWEVDEFGRGVLSAVNTNGGADYVPLSKIGAVSVRRVLNPANVMENVLEACGAVRSKE